jgi:hypothetical protein
LVLDMWNNTFLTVLIIIMGWGPLALKDGKSDLFHRKCDLHHL